MKTAGSLIEVFIWVKGYNKDILSKVNENYPAGSVLELKVRNTSIIPLGACKD